MFFHSQRLKSRLVFHDFHLWYLQLFHQVPFGVKKFYFVLHPLICSTAYILHRDRYKLPAKV